MKIVIAPDSFKESLSALEVADAIEAGFRDVFAEAEYVKIPVADGGEGTAQTLIDALNGEWREMQATGPTGAPVDAAYGLVVNDGLAVIEMARASGLELVPESQRNPMTATSRGLGELIADAVNHGARRIVVGLGGSATNDAGAGMLQALGARLLDAAGRELPPGGAALSRLERLEVGALADRIEGLEIDVACDVTNPLVGPNGASFVFGPQKGASESMAAGLDQALSRFAEVVRRDLGQDIAMTPGGGAAGGLGAALMAACGARLRPGCELVFETIGLEEHLQGADLVITGEGRSDGQTLGGKAPLGVATMAARHRIPVIVLSGALATGAEALLDHGVEAVFAAVRRPCDLQDALAEGSQNLRAAARNIAAALRLGMRL